MFLELRTSIKRILEESVRDDVPSFSSWSFQGLGMLRLYLTKEIRLHVWGPDLAFENVSTIHTHPWDFSSIIVSGQLANHRIIYEHPVVVEENKTQPSHDRYLLQCGPGGCLMSTPEPVSLVTEKFELLTPGATYSQLHHEIHESKPRPGCVSLITRSVPEGVNPDHAYVFTEHGKPWVSAEPRPATAQEISTIIGCALDNWDKL